jgi:hypothetical protein
MTELADYYCSLPILSIGLSAALHRSRGLCQEIYSSPTEFLTISKKLRNDVLFKDALILSLGPFHEPRYSLLGDPELQEIAEKVYNDLCVRVLHAQGLLMNLSRNCPRFVKNCESHIEFILVDENVSEPRWAE